MKRKRGGSKKSDAEGDQQQLEAEAAAAAEGAESVPPPPAPGEESVATKLKPKRGRPKKSQGGDGGEHEVEKVKRELEEVTRQLAEAKQPTEDATKKRAARGSPKKSEGDRREPGASGNGRESTPPPPGQQRSVPAKVKPKRGTPKKSRGDGQDGEPAGVQHSPPPGVQPTDNIAVKKSKGASPQKVRQVDTQELQVAANGRQNTPPCEEQTAAAKPKLKRGRPKKSQRDGEQPTDSSTVKGQQGGTPTQSQVESKELEAAEANVRQSTPPGGEHTAAAEPKSKRGRPKKSQRDGQTGLEAAEVRQSSRRGGQPAGSTMQGKGGSPTKSQGDRQEIEGAASGRQSLRSRGEQTSAAKPKAKRGKAKEPQGEGQGLKAAEPKQSPPPVEQPLNNKQEPKRVGPNESDSGMREVKAEKKMQVTAPPGEQPKENTPKRKPGRPKKSEKDKQETKSEKRQKAAAGRRQVNDRMKKTSNRSVDPSDAVSPGKASKGAAPKVGKRRWLTKIELDGSVFEVGDDVYVRKSEYAASESDTEVEDCRICGATKEETMLECDSCLAGYHLTCLKPPLESVPEGDWVCPYCEKGEKPPQPESSQQRHRSARERFLACELWAARIERMWRAKDGTYWFTARWLLVPEDTALGRQPHNGKREVFRSNKRDDNEMDSILRHCYVMSPQDYKSSTGEGDDVFFCEYEYDEQWSKFKRIEYLDDNVNRRDGGDDDEPCGSSDESEEDAEGQKKRRSVGGKGQNKSIKAANKRRNYSGGFNEVGAKSIPEDVRKRPQTDFERAKAALALSAVPSSLPCRDRERSEISAFLKESVAAGEQCLGRCLYISGVPGTGKTATVLEVIKELGSKMDLGELPPYRFIEINGLRLPSPDHIYTIMHEALTGQHVGWKKAQEFLEDRFTNGSNLKGLDARPCVLLIDELDLLVTSNQAVLYNIFDWPCRPQSRLIIIGIANTMDLPERMLPRIASRMGMHRISFGPYSHKELELIISTRLNGVEVFDKQAAEFASRKVAAVSGDTRRALELCRRAVEVAEARVGLLSSALSAPASGEPSTSSVAATTQDMNQGLQAEGRLVTMADVDAAISEMFSAPQIQVMRRSAKLEKVFLVAMVCEQRHTSMAETTFEKIAIKCSEMCVSNGEDKPDWDTLLAIGCKLGESRLLLCEPGGRHRLQKLQLNLPCDDVSFALKEDEQTPWLAKYL